MTIFRFYCQIEPSSSDIINQPTCGTNLQTPQVVLSTTVLSVQAVGLAVERETGAKGDPFKGTPLCFTKRPSRSHCMVCIHRVQTTLCIASLG